MLAGVSVRDSMSSSVKMDRGVAILLVDSRGFMFKVLIL
ncbi:hypothetical protein P775_01340 [Puniceibacterium antarcticum]|uniref:Uncharacterized protein n=1 Tax=Puniceibacterium antarcticum TaxID=1206336 RepID=A0A2G8RKW4_9RHOB|nr:hypothetical protein P775_01340 [Puniceibacterium antarcticum]